MLIRLLLTAVVLLTVAGGASANPNAKRACTWGASSITLSADGVQSTPVTTGCVP